MEPGKRPLGSQGRNHRKKLTAARRVTGARQTHGYGGDRKSRREQIIRRRRMLLVGAVALLVIVIVVIVCLVTGVFENRAEKSTLTLEEDGTVVCEEVTDFGADYYDGSELRSYAREQIRAYNDANGADSVNLERVAVGDGEAYMRTRYQSPEDYRQFTGYEMFQGTIAQAQEAGYTFADTFVSVTDGAKGDSVGTDQVLADTEKNVLILRENITVTVEGTILYVSDESTTVESGDTVSIAQADGNEDATTLTYIIYE